MEEHLRVVRLSEIPEKINEVCKLIETEFQYSPENSVKTDFYPLLREENFHNNFLLLYKESDDNEILIGHIGTKPCLYQVYQNDYPILHMGGIAIANDYQGKGYFKYFFDYVLNLLGKRHAFLFLWSDKPDLYKKFNFFPVGGQIHAREEYKTIEGYQKIKANDLTDEQLAQLKEIYDLNSHIFFKPRREDWNEVKETKSINIYINEVENNIIAYYLEGKGQDLNNVIHEFGIHPDHYDTELLKFQENSAWIPFQLYPLDQDFFQLQYTALCRLGNPYFLQTFVSDYTMNEIQNYKNDNGNVSFVFDNHEYNCTEVELYEMLWGPQIVKEFFGRYQGLYVPGIESI